MPLPQDLVRVAPPGKILYVMEKMEEIEDITEDFVQKLFPPRKPESHKGTFGILLAVAGSNNCVGAALLLASAALRCGAGKCILASAPRVVNAAAVYAPESMFVELKNQMMPLKKALAGASAVAAGPGLGQDARAKKILRCIFQNCRSPLLLDADALNLISRPEFGVRAAAFGRNFPLILTPHPKEAARLLSVNCAEILANREAAVNAIAAKFNAIAVLKGNKTLVSGGEGKIMRNTTGNPGLARGGSGDVLTGIIGALLARGIEPSKAAAAGVLIHGLAADYAAAANSEEAMLPSDIVPMLCQVFSKFRSAGGPL